MRSSPRLIFCQGGNPRSMSLARDLGWEPGSRSDDTLYPCHRPLALLDIHWKRYDWGRHLDVARQERPWLAAVPDIEEEGQLPEALRMAEELSPFCENLLFIPKAFGVIERIPETIQCRRVVLGYSVPSTYGGTEVPFFEFGQRPVHLLGGSPCKQRQIARYLNVISADGNMASKIASWGKFFDQRGKSTRGIAALDGQKWPDDKEMHYEALRRSLSNLRVFWGVA